MQTTTDTHDFNLKVVHDEQAHAMRVIVSDAEGKYMIDGGRWIRPLMSMGDVALAVIPCTVWNELYDQMRSDVLLDLAEGLTQEFGGPA